jgi:ABC-type Fe3+-hydroxamate transport system substrate-binding protein
MSLDDSDAAVTVKDGEGTSFTFDQPVNKIITIGVGVTATAIGVGALDKIVVCDSYSKTNKDPLFDDLRKLVEEGKIAANGNIYNSGKEQLKIDIIDAAEPTKGNFDKDKDVVIAVVSPSYKANLSFLEENGFKNVMYWSTVDDYNDIIDFVETISMVCNGKVDSHAGSMRAVQEKITTTLAKAKPETAKAFYVTYSSGVFKVGNTTSITTAMIEAAGGNVITKDPSKSASTIEVNLTTLIEANPDAIIFADDQVFNSAEHMKNLRTLVGNDVEIYGLEAIWNNFSIESAKGVWKMAGAMYPDLFDGDMPTPSDSSDDSMIYIIGAVVAVIIIALVAFYFMRPSGRSKRKGE